MIWRFACAAVVVMLATACVQKAARPDAPSAEPPRSGKPPRKPPAAPPLSMPPVADTGGLYAPHIKDSGPATPPDVSVIPEPLPVVEPLARYGNRSPYTVLGRNYVVMDSADGYVENGVASWYGNKFHGRPTSSFEPYDMYKFTAAHRSLPLPSYVQVTNLENGKSVVVRVNDRGPFHGNRLIDLSYVAAVKLDMHHQGVARVEVRALVPVSSDVRLANQSQPTIGPVGAGVGPTVQAPPGRLYLQVASFGQRANADALKLRLRSARVGNVELQRAELDGIAVWRVRIGPYSLPDNLERAREKVRSLGLGEPQTVRH